MTTSVYIQDEASDKYSYQSSLTGTDLLYIAPGRTGTWNAFCERYGYKRQTLSFQPALGGDVTFPTSWVDDVSLTVLDPTVVSAYTNLNTAQKVNDYEAYWRTTEEGIIYSDTLLRNGDVLDWTPYNVVIDPTAAVPYSITGNTITVKADKLVANTITTTGTVSAVNGGSILGVVTDVSGNSTQLNFLALTGCSVAVFKADGTLYSFAANQTGTYNVSIPSSFSNSMWSYVITKEAKKYQEGSFTLNASLPYNVTYVEIVDDKVVDTSQSTVTGWASIASTQQMYDYWSYWVTTQDGILWYKTVSWSGSVLDVTNADIDLDPAAANLTALDPVTHKVTIRSSSLSGDLTTGGTVNRLGGSVTTGLVTDATGTTTILTFTGFTGTNKLYLETAAGGQKVYSTVTTASEVVYLLPSEATAGSWKYAAKKTAYSPVAGSVTVAGGGRLTVQVAMSKITQPSGQDMFTGAPVPSSLTVDWTTDPSGNPRIKCGDQAYDVQAVYNATDLAMSTEDGLRWLAHGNDYIRIASLPAGNFVFLSNGWRFMESAVGNSNATINGFAISTEGLVVDAVNGNVTFIAETKAISDADLAKLRETWDRVVNYVEPKVDTLIVDVAKVDTDVLAVGAAVDKVGTDVLAVGTQVGNVNTAVTAVDTKITNVDVDLTDIKGTGFVKDTHSLTSIESAVQTSIAVSA